MNSVPKPELWSPETIAEFMLDNAVDENGYRSAIRDVHSMGIDPFALDPKQLFYNDQPWRRPELYPEARLSIARES